MNSEIFNMHSRIISRRLLLVLLLGCIVRVNGMAKPRICMGYIDPFFNSIANDSEEDYNDRNVTDSQEPAQVECKPGFDFCYALWKKRSNGTMIIRQGCWQYSEKVGPCQKEQCVTTRPTDTSQDLRFCCCSSDLCNMNETSFIQLEPQEISSNDTDVPEIAEFQPVWKSPLFWIVLIISALVTASLLIVFGFRRPPKSGPETAPLAPSGPGYSSNLQNVDNLKLCSMIGQGKYGTVWKGMINEQPVAVKIFPAQHKQYFVNERNIYSVPFMDCFSLLSYFGCDERRNLDDNIEYFLVLSLAPYGCLQDWLMENTTSYSIFCKMAKSITRGLSHLHTEIKKGDQVKPCICHRDFNTRNILVKADFTCCVADFGFALKTFGSKYEYKGEIAVAETKSINEVGTLRYMAPEILEGAVNLRDCETALKQIDVYSLGLVLWELCVRCHDLYPHGQSPPAYKAPYEAEIGKNPTFEQMQVLVSKHKARPLFPPGWGGGPAGKIARDTCEECWDHDAEARLTALCAEERIHELSNLRPRSYISRGPSPPLSANNLVSTAAPLTYVTSNHATYHNADASVITPPNQIIPIVNNCGSETTTTILSMASPITEKNHNIYSQPIQAFQGRNPCQERNLAPVNIQNQVFIEKSKKHSFVERGQENSLSCLEDDVSVEDLISSNRNVIDQTIMGEGFPKQNNTDKKLRGWHGVRALIQKKLFRKDASKLNIDPEEKSNLVDNRLAIRIDSASPTKDIRVNLVDIKNSKYQNGNNVQTRLESSSARPSNLDLNPITVRVNGLSVDNAKSNLIRNISEDSHTRHKKSLSTDCDYSDSFITSPRIVISKSASAVKNLNSAAEDKAIKRQRSLEVFKEIFGSKASTERLRDPSQRVKTPGDVPPSVRKVRASKTLSLYDDRMMGSDVNSL